MKLKKRDIIKEGRTDLEMADATLHKAPVIMYSDLCRIANKKGAVRTISQMFKQSNQNIILLQDPNDEMTGHWIGVVRNLPKREIYFFSTYGGKPDEEKVEWLPKELLRRSDQLMNIFNDAFKVYSKHGWKVFYNDFPYQVEGDDTATCGIFTAAFLRSKKNPDEFAKDTKKIIDGGKDPAIVYYKKYFH